MQRPRGGEARVEREDRVWQLAEGPANFFFFFNKTQTLNIVSFVAARSHFPTPPRVLNE